MSSFSTPTPSPSSQGPPGGSGGGSGGNGGGGPSSSSNLANSASLYRTFHHILSSNVTCLIPCPVYTFLATLVLLLSVSGAIVIRSFILRRRHRRMVEEAIRNGTWVPTTPAARNSRVDLAKKPELWEAYLGSGGWQLGGLGSGKELDIDSNWKSEYSRDWESIKPIYAGYIDSVSGSTPDRSASLSSPASIPIPTPINVSAPRRDEEENRRNAEVSSRSLFTRARTFLNSNSNVPASSSADNGAISRSNSANISMTELGSSSPSTIRVAVLVAMPSPSSHGSSTPPSASISSRSQPTTSHPLDSSSLPPTTIGDEEQPLPHLVMGVADVVVGRSGNSSTWDNVRTRGEGTKGEDKVPHSRGSSFAEP